MRTLAEILLVLIIIGLAISTIHYCNPPKPSKTDSLEQSEAPQKKTVDSAILNNAQEHIRDTIIITHYRTIYKSIAALPDDSAASLLHKILGDTGRGNIFTPYAIRKADSLSFQTKEDSVRIQEKNATIHTDSIGLAAAKQVMATDSVIKKDLKAEIRGLKRTKFVQSLLLKGAAVVIVGAAVIEGVLYILKP